MVPRCPSRRTGPTVVLLWAHVPATARPALLPVLADALPALTVAAAGPGWEERLPSDAVRPHSLGAAADLVRERLAGASRHARPADSR